MLAKSKAQPSMAIYSDEAQRIEKYAAALSRVQIQHGQRRLRTEAKTNECLVTELGPNRLD